MIQSAAQLFSTKIQTFAHRLYKEMGPEGGRNREIKVYTQTWLTADVNRPPGATCPSGGQNYVIEVCILMGLLEAAAELLVLLSPLWPQDMYGNLWGGRLPKSITLDWAPSGQVKMPAKNGVSMASVPTPIMSEHEENTVQTTKKWPNFPFLSTSFN